MMSSKTFLGKAMRFVWVFDSLGQPVTNPREVISYSAAFSACGRSVAWHVVLELLQDLKESETNAVCLSSAADALEQGVLVTFLGCTCCCHSFGMF